MRCEEIKEDKIENGFKINELINSFKLKIFTLFETIELYVIKFHQILLNDLNVQYPFDLICFASLGFILSWIKSFFNVKSKFIYNQPDNPDLSILITNKFKDLTNLINTTEKSKNIKEDNFSGSSNNINENSDLKKINDQIFSLSASIKNLSQELITNFTGFEEYLKTISTSQIEISNTLVKDESTPGN